MQEEKTAACVSASAALGGTTRRPRRATRARDLSRARHYRAADIFALHGIPASTLCKLAQRAHDPIPSRLIAGRSGRRGLRLFPVADVEAWLARQSG